jgi:hypothetical protein
LVPAEGLSPPRLKAPLPVITAASLQLIAAIRLTADQYITWLGGPGAMRPRLVDAMKRVAENMADLPVMAFASDPPQTRHAGRFT